MAFPLNWHPEIWCWNALSTPHMACAIEDCVGLYGVSHCSATLDSTAFVHVCSPQIGLNPLLVMHSTRSPESSFNISMSVNWMFSRCGRCAGMQFCGFAMVRLRKSDKNFLMPIWFEHKLADTLVCGRGQGVSVSGPSRAYRVMSAPCRPHRRSPVSGS